MPTTSTARRSRPGVHVLVCLLLITVGAVGASAVQTNGGHISIQELTIPGRDGSSVSANLYRPRTATARHRAPLVVVTPGFNQTKESVTSYALELARRGFVTISVDPWGQGNSSRQPADSREPAIKPVIDYATRTHTMTYVDTSRVGIVGHSAGGSRVLRTAAIYGAEEDKALQEATAPASPGGRTITAEERRRAEKLNPIRSVYVAGWLRHLDAETFRTIHSNVGLGYALHDEGGFRNKNHTGALRDAPEAIAVINSGLPRSQRIAHVDVGRGYGSTADRTYRIVNQDHTLHFIQPMTPSAVKPVLTFFDHTLGAPHPVTNQTWWLKELFNGLSLVAAVVMLVPLTRLLLTIPWFTAARAERDPATSAPGPAVFWGVVLLQAVVAAITYVSMPIALWLVVNGILGLILSWVMLRRGSGASGVRMSWSQTVRTVVLALADMAVFQTILAIVHGLFGVDYRLFVLAVRPLTVHGFVASLTTFPVLLLLLLANSLLVSAASRDRRGVLLGLAVPIGLAVILVIQYATLFSTGTVLWRARWMQVMTLWSLLPMLIVVPLFHRAFLRSTGRVWLGPLVTAAVLALMI